MKKLFFFFFSFIFFSCDNRQEKTLGLSLETMFSLDNAQIKEAIIEYQEKLFADYAKSISNGDSIYVCVFIKDINDTIKRCVIGSLAEYIAFRYISPFVICNINGHHVFVTMNSGENENDFVLSPIDEKKLIQIYFPKRYKEMSEDKMQHILNYEAENCYLTFNRGELLDMRYRIGLFFDRLLIEDNGKKEWY